MDPIKTSPKSSGMSTTTLIIIIIIVVLLLISSGLGIYFALSSSSTPSTPQLQATYAQSAAIQAEQDAKLKAAAVVQAIQADQEAKLKADAAAKTAAQAAAQAATQAIIQAEKDAKLKEQAEQEAKLKAAEQEAKLKADAAAKAAADAAAAAKLAADAAAAKLAAEAAAAAAAAAARPPTVIQIPLGVEGSTVNFNQCPAGTSVTGGKITYGMYTGGNSFNPSLTYNIPAGTTSLVINNSTMGNDPVPFIGKAYNGFYTCK